MSNKTNIGIQSFIPDNNILPFIKDVATYFMDFLETDFHKRRLPKRHIKLHSRDNLLTGINLSKYPAFNRLAWNLLNNNFDPNKFNSLQKGIYRADIPKDLVDIIRIQLNKVTNRQINSIINDVVMRVEEAIALNSKDFELAMNYASETTSTILKQHLITPLINNIEKPLETLNLGDDNITYLMEEELADILSQPIERAISKILKHFIAGDRVITRNVLKDAVAIDEIKTEIQSFFENFRVFDLYNEIYEMHRNMAILDKQEFYFYFFDITYKKIKYPIFYIPVTVQKADDGLQFEFDPQLYINKKALGYIAQEINGEKGKFGTIASINERIIYRVRYNSNLASALQPIVDELLDFFELDSKILVHKTLPQTSRGFYTKITNSCYIALFDKSDEALVNDYEMILQLLESDGHILADAFNGLIDDFVNRNPERVTIEVENEWDAKDVADKLIYSSPIPLNAEQLQIVSALKKTQCKYVTVEGPPGTGKSHTITAIAFNAIMDNQSVLILSDKKEALDVVEDKLTATMNQVRVDKNFQNPLLRLGKTGSTYSQILSTSSMNKIKDHYRVVKKEIGNIESNIIDLTTHLKSEIKNEIDCCNQIDLKKFYQMMSRENYFADSDYPIDISYLEQKPEYFDVIKEFRKTIIDLKAIFKDTRIQRLFSILNIDTTSITSANQLFQSLRPLKEFKYVINFLRERYSANIFILSKIKAFGDEDLRVLENFILEFEKLSGLIAVIFKRRRIKELNSRFQRQFTDSEFDLPHKQIQLLKSYSEVFTFSVSNLKKHVKAETARTLDFCYVIHSLIKFNITQDVFYKIISPLDKLQGLIQRLSEDSNLSKLKINWTSFDSVFDNFITRLNDEDLDQIGELVSFKKDAGAKFNKIPIVNYSKQQKVIEELTTVQMTYKMDERVIDFFEKNSNDAVALREVIKKKEKFPKEQFAKIKHAFPCILAGIRDYAEYIPLEPDIFDLLIIDEASQVSIAQTLPALLRAKKILILGDKKQFSNIKAAHARSDTNTEYLNRLRDTFTKTIGGSSDKLVRLQKFDIKTSVLDFFEHINNYNIQLMKYFRGYKEIISYSNKFFYRDALQVMKIRGKHINDVIQFTILENDGKKEFIQNTNTREIEFIINELENLKANKIKSSVGIITPHTNQQKLLMERISNLPDKDYFFDEWNLKIMTFDTCQGEERDIIFYSMVATDNDDKLWGVFIKDLSNVNIEEDGQIKAQRLNVGFSRAKEKMHFVLSKTVDKFTGSIGEAIRYYNHVLDSALSEKLPDTVDPNSPMERNVLHWIYSTPFWQNNSERSEVFPQFELGKYLKQLDSRYNHPSYRVDFLMLYTDYYGENHKIIIEYDGFYEHFKNAESIDDINYWHFYSDEDVYRQKVLESYGYSFIRINRFNSGEDPVKTLNERLIKLLNIKKDNQVVNNIQETVAGIAEKTRKECPKCKKIKTIQEFADNSLKSGYGKICRECKGFKMQRLTGEIISEDKIRCPLCGNSMTLIENNGKKHYRCWRSPNCKGIRPYPYYAPR